MVHSLNSVVSPNSTSIDYFSLGPLLLDEFRNDSLIVVIISDHSPPPVSLVPDFGLWVAEQRLRVNAQLLRGPVILLHWLRQVK